MFRLLLLSLLFLWLSGCGSHQSDEATTAGPANVVSPAPPAPQPQEAVATDEVAGEPVQAEPAKPVGPEPPAGEIELLEEMTEARLREWKSQLVRESQGTIQGKFGRVRPDESGRLIQSADVEITNYIRYSDPECRRFIFITGRQEKSDTGSTDRGTTYFRQRLTEDQPLYYGRFLPYSDDWRHLRSLPSEAGREGRWFRTYDNGVPRSAGTYSLGRRNGVFVCWDERGIKRWEGTYEQGILKAVADLTKEEASSDPVATLLAEGMPWGSGRLNEVDEAEMFALRLEFERRRAGGELKEVDEVKIRDEMKMWMKMWKAKKLSARTSLPRSGLKEVDEAMIWQAAWALLTVQSGNLRDLTGRLPQLIDWIQQSPGPPSAAVLKLVAPLVDKADPASLPRLTLEESLNLAKKQAWQEILSRGEASLVPVHREPAQETYVIEPELTEMAALFTVNQGDACVEQLREYLTKTPTPQLHSSIPGAILRRLGPKAEPLVPLLMDEIRRAHQYQDVESDIDRLWALLLNAGPAAGPAVVNFLKTYNGKIDSIPPKIDPTIKAITVLHHLPPSGDTIAFLRSVAKKAEVQKPTSTPTRGRSAKKSTKQEEAAQPAYNPVLDHAVAQTYIAGALARFAPDEGVPLLISRIKAILERDSLWSDDLIVIPAAARFLRESGAAATPAVPLLRELIGLVSRQEIKGDSKAAQVIYPPLKAEIQLALDAIESASPNRKADDSAVVNEGTVRVFRDSTGEYSVEAVFVAMQGGNVVLRKADGQQIQVPLERLSKSDQEWVTEHASGTR